MVYLVANRFGRRWIRDVAPRIDTSEAAPSIRRLRRIRDHWVPAVLVVVAGVAGSAAQIPKQLGFFDHTTASELLFRIGDVALIATCTLIATLLFAYPLYLTKEKVVADLDRVRENIHNLADQHELAQKLANEDPEQLDEVDPTEHGLTDSAGVILVYQVALLVASPGITVLTRSINTFINTYWF